MKTLTAKATVAATSLLVLLSLLYLSLASGQSDRALVRQKPSGSSDERRVALVIGNSGYQNTPPLTNPRNDAAAVGESLKRLGFDVDVQLDLTRTAMEEVLRHFGDRLEGAKVALFFYAGHGLQVNGANYLVPIDAKLAKERDLSYEAVELAKVLREMEAAQRTNLVILDACRDNPLSRSLARSLSGKSRSVIGQGLAPIDAATGTLIAYATKDGNVAADGAGQHSPYTDALLKHLETPGLEVGLLLRRVREEVVNATGEKQVPWEYGSLIGEFYFKSPATTTAAPPTTTATAAPKPESAPPAATPSSTVDPKAVELSYWDSIKDSNNEALLKSYLERYPKGTFADIARIKLQELAKPKPAPKPAPPPVATTTGFSVTSCGSIKDNKTGLEWFVGPDRNTTWPEADNWVRKLDTCGGGWRLPSIVELKTLYNPKVTSGIGHYEKGQHWPAHIPPEFKEIGGGSWVWSKESISANDARSFNFNQGLAVVYSKDNTTYSTRSLSDMGEEARIEYPKCAGAWSEESAGEQPIP